LHGSIYRSALYRHTWRLSPNKPACHLGKQAAYLQLQKYRLLSVLSNGKVKAVCIGWVKQPKQDDSVWTFRHKSIDHHYENKINIWAYTANTENQYRKLISSDLAD
jgi:hypothetical protein